MERQQIARLGNVPTLRHDTHPDPDPERHEAGQRPVAHGEDQRGRRRAKVLDREDDEAPENEQRVQKEDPSDELVRRTRDLGEAGIESAEGLHRLDGVGVQRGAR